MLGSTYLEILRDDLTNIIIIFYAVFKEQYSDINLTIHASYVAIIDSFCYFSIKQTSCQILNGGDEEIRTPDPLLARQVLSQLSYAPIIGQLTSR